LMAEVMACATLRSTKRTSGEGTVTAAITKPTLRSRLRRVKLDLLFTLKMSCTGLPGDDIRGE